jgi:hypothetical protein
MVNDVMLQRFNMRPTLDHDFDTEPWPGWERHTQWVETALYCCIAASADGASHE